MAIGKKTGGRAKGTPNKNTAQIRDAIESADPIGYLTDLIANDDASEQVRVRAAEFLAKRIAPEVRETPLDFDIGNVDSPQDAQAALGRVITALASGEILPSEAKTICDIIDKLLKAYETGELAAKVKQLEETML